jgi:hypothetical protein
MDACGAAPTPAAPSGARASIVKEFGERYLPAELFRRSKKPFPINAYVGERMKIAPAYFERSFITDL